MKRFVTLLLLTLLVPKAHAIVGGKVAIPRSHITKLVAQVSTPSGACTGTFITRRLVLTAAHCFDSYASCNFTIRLGHDPLSPFFETRSDKCVMNRMFDRSGAPADDIALIHTVDPLPASFPVTKLATKTPSSGQVALAAGFGLQRYDFLDMRPAELKYVILKTSWTWWLARSFSIDIGPKAGISFGDSGGPLFVLVGREFQQIGVAHAIAGSRPDSMTIAMYNSTVRNRQWILDAAKYLSK